MTPDSQVVSLLRGELVDVLSAMFFLVVGLLACLTAIIRRRSGARILVWIGLWSGMFGTSMMVQSPAFIAVLPRMLARAAVAIGVSTSYLTIVAASLSFLELTAGKLRSFLKVLLLADGIVGVTGIVWFLVFNRADTFIVYNQMLAVIGLLSLLAAVTVPSLSRRYLLHFRHRLLAIGTFIFAAEALCVNVGRPFGFNVPAIYSSLGFAVLLLSFGSVAMDMIDGNERRLLAIDNELAIARQLQFSILPENPPEITGLQIAAAYEPMTAVAGDFYEFLPVDAHRAGFLVADVSGHGVPAALIASMVKVATQSVKECGSDPSEVLRRLGTILSGHLRGQFVSAAYLWIDTEAGYARYSAAGHPPLLQWNDGDGVLTRIESNGLLFGVMPDCKYPSCEIALSPGDRLLLYTDGVTEPENAGGEPFGEHRLGEIVRAGESLTAAELSKRLLSELRAWQPDSQTQQDDITLLIIDVSAPTPQRSARDRASEQAAQPVSG